MFSSLNMILIVGLGNPGEKYQKTRHNIGFGTIDNLQLTIDDFSNWKLDKKSRSLITSGRISIADGQKSKVVLAKPQTFMNNSGQAVKKIIKNLKLEDELRDGETKRKKMAKPSSHIENLIIIHDDIDLPLGKIRIVKNRGAAGHKGVESIIRELRTKNFIRFRIGIKQNEKLKAQNEKQLEKFVLEKFTKKEGGFVKEVVEKTVEAIEFSLKEDLEKAMSKFNK